MLRYSDFIKKSRTIRGFPIEPKLVFSHQIESNSNQSISKSLVGFIFLVCHISRERSKKSIVLIVVNSRATEPLLDQPTKKVGHGPVPVPNRKVHTETSACAVPGTIQQQCCTSIISAGHLEFVRPTTSLGEQALPGQKSMSKEDELLQSSSELLGHVRASQCSVHHNTRGAVTHGHESPIDGCEEIVV